jgi:hypothetical protein
MATVITAGNATDGLKITPDNTGILELKTGTGAGTTALTLNASQNATLAGTLQVAGVTTSLYPIVSGTAITLTNQTAPEFTGIPSWAKRVTVMFSGVSTNGANPLQVQLGTSSGYEIASYNATAGVVTGGYPGVAAAINFTTGFGMEYTSQSSAFLVSGHMVLTNISGNIWVASGVIGTSSTGTLFLFSGNKTTGAALDRVRVIGSASGNPSDTFDAGTINIMWE